MPTQLELSGVTVAYGETAVVRDVSFRLGEGRIGCLLGPSGCGKTTLLRAIAGFEPVSRGQIRLHGRTVSHPGATLAPELRRVGMVFQDFALFPHLTVERNIGFGLHKLPRARRAARVEELLRLVELMPARRLYPHHLSGGMQQRVALARAMAPHPDILLLDEPFSSMDAELRQQLAREVRQILKRDGVTAILVTHDQLEAFAMADLIGVIGAGRLHQWDSGYELYHAPRNRFVADFIGEGAWLPGKVIDERCVETQLGPIAGERPHGLSPGQPAEVLIRPDDVACEETGTIRAEVIARAFRGSAYLYRVRTEVGAEVLCLARSRQDHRVGEVIGISLRPHEPLVFATALAG